MGRTIMQILNQYFNLNLKNEEIKKVLNKNKEHLTYATNEEIIFIEEDRRTRVNRISKNKLEVISGFNLTFLCTLIDNKITIELRQNAEDFAEYFEDYSYFEIILDEYKAMKQLKKAHTFNCLDSSVILNDEQIDKLSIEEKNNIINNAVINFFENFEKEDDFYIFLEDLVRNMCIVLDSNVPESVETIMKFSNL